MTRAFAFAALFAASLAYGQEQPDVAILATVHAKTLRFSEVPQVNVTFAADPRNHNVWNSDREHLPDQVQPYVTYRDIGIRLTITSTLPDIEQILNDALGTQQENVNGPKATPAPAHHSDARKRAPRRAATAADHDKPQSR